METNLEKELLKEQENLATFVHGTLFSLHTLSALYNLQKRNYRDVVIHGLAATYDLIATFHHNKSRNYLKNEK